MASHRVYDSLPALAQSAAISAYGYRLRLDRQTGRYRSHCAKLREQELLPADAVAELQRRLVVEKVREAYEAVPFYRQRMDTLGLKPSDFRTLDDLSKMPFTTKQDVRQFGPEMRSRRVPRWRIRRFSTGGTTGTSVPIAVDLNALQLEYAIFHTYQWGWAGVRPGDPWVMINGRPVVPLKQQQPPYWRYNAAAREHFFSCFHINDRTIPIYLERMAELRPAMLHLYPSNAYLFARYMADHGLTGCVRPRAIISTSETLHPYMRELIEEQFGAKVFNHYLGDYSVHICECEFGGLHVAPTYGFLEMIPIDGTSEPGLCEMVLTSLANSGTVLLRYRVGDTAVALEDPCPCGRDMPALKMIWGRTAEVITTPVGNVITASNLTDVFKNTPMIRRCQFVQREPESLLARLEVAEAFSDEDKAHFLAEVRSRVGPELAIEVEIVDEIPLTAAGKFRFIINETGHALEPQSADAA